MTTPHVVTAFAALLVIAASPTTQASNGQSISNVNGEISARPGEIYDSLTTVNGDVRVGHGATVGEAKTVNGGIELEDAVKIGTVSTVNGALRIGEGTAVEHGASTVNGGVRLAPRATVGGDVSTVSGEIQLEGAEVSGQLKTVNGNIDLTAGAHVRGGILIKKPSGWSWGKEEPVHVHICSTCVVDGELRFERPVELRVDDGAKIGKVIGDAVTRR
jgi:carbonic anhydrase/acetyltransferase-like protein (isoleucine patch superfamily)